MNYNRLNKAADHIGDTYYHTPAIYIEEPPDRRRLDLVLYGYKYFSLLRAMLLRDVNA